MSSRTSDGHRNGCRRRSGSHSPPRPCACVQTIPDLHLYRVGATIVSRRLWMYQGNRRYWNRLLRVLMVIAHSRFGPYLPGRLVEWSNLAQFLGAGIVRRSRTLGSRLVGPPVVILVISEHRTSDRLTGPSVLIHSSAKTANVRRPVRIIGRLVHAPTTGAWSGIESRLLVGRVGASRSRCPTKD